MSLNYEYYIALAFARKSLYYTSARKLPLKWPLLTMKTAYHTPPMNGRLLYRQPRHHSSYLSSKHEEDPEKRSAAKQRNKNSQSNPTPNNNQHIKQHEPVHMITSRTEPHPEREQENEQGFEDLRPEVDPRGQAAPGSVVEVDLVGDGE